MSLIEIEIDGSFPLDTHRVVRASQLTLKLPRPPKLIYRHGWQSWSLTSWTEPTPLPVQQPALLHPMQVDPAYSEDTTPNGSWLGAVELTDGDVVLLGALGLESHVWMDGNQVQGRSEAGDIEWFVARGSELDVFALYADQIGKRFGVTHRTSNPRVWCSWYSLYSSIDEQILHKTFDALEELPFDVIQVDDGWQVSIGDWESNEKFPAGMSALADKIKATGRMAGLWLAPFIAVERSKLFQENPQWFLKNEGDGFVSAGFNWGQRMFALDTTHPEVLAWLKDLMTQVRSWGFEYVKLDFLYGAALPGRRFQNTPRETAFRLGLQTIRSALGYDAFLLACGAPILPSLGLCDAIRIGPDVAGDWETRRDALLLYNPTTPGVKNAIRTSSHRLWLKSIVGIDPDVVYFSKKGSSLSPTQKLLLQDLASICDFKASSDLPQQMTDIERQALRDFLNDTKSAQQIGRYEYLINGRPVDFSQAITLSRLPHGWSKIQARFLAWIGNHRLALRIWGQLNKILVNARKRSVARLLLS